MNMIGRRRFLGAMASGFAGLSATTMTSCTGGEPSAQKPPNIIVILADDAGWADVGYHGSEINTPNIDRLVNEGVELDKFYVYPVCSPTRAALLTGRPPSRFGILGPIAMRSTLALPDDATTLAEMLRDTGYDTAITGKWHLGLRPEVGPDKYGFTHTYGYLHGQIDQLTHYYKNGDRSWNKNGEFTDEEGHATDLITNEAIRYVKSKRESSNPFFLYVPYSVPHYPLQEDDRWVDPYRETIPNESRRLYAASMTHMDDAIGRLIATLAEEGIAEDTLVIFMSDNGGQDEWTPTFEYDGKFAANDRLGNNLPLRDWKGSLYEGGVRVPALMYWPGTLTPSTVTAPMSVCDIMPTIAGLTGSPQVAVAGCEGDDVWAAVAGGELAKDRVFYWRTDGQLAVRRGDWKLVHTGATPEEGSAELFNIADDPLEKSDLASEKPDIVSALREELQRQFVMDK